MNQNCHGNCERGTKFSHDIQVYEDVAQAFIDKADNEEVESHRVYIEAFGFNHNLPKAPEEGAEGHDSTVNAPIIRDTDSSRVWKANESRGGTDNPNKPQQSTEYGESNQIGESFDSEALKAAKERSALLASQIDELQFEISVLMAKQKRHEEKLKPLIQEMVNSLAAIGYKVQEVTKTEEPGSQKH
ncbi:MAG: hypothetical protein M1831_006828 [Alyxoria varia]|nr:MAG: hypothetical protein M1831_006828 [Alyxoria varia]